MPILVSVAPDPRSQLCERPWRRPLLAAALTLALLTGIAAPSLAQDGEGALDGPGADALADSVIQEQVEHEHQIALEDEERRRQPEEIAARERSRSAYEDLSPADARRLALEHFPDLLAVAPTAPIDLPPGAEIERYYGTHAALIDPPGADVDIDATNAEPGIPTTDPGGVLQSTVPLRTEDEHGDLRPVDGELQDRGSYLEPSNATVEAELPDELATGVTLPELDLSLAPEGAAQAAPGTPATEDTVFYANLGNVQDVDFLAAATPTGTEALWQLRSASSPERLALDLELPAGAALEPAWEGRGARIVRDGETAAIVTPPIAFDADGESVPVSMRVAGSQLELSIEHRAGDWKYPLLVDPVIEYWFWANYWPDVTGWYWEDSCADPCNRFNQGGNYAISSGSFPNTFYWQSEYAQWVFPAPPNTYVEQAEFWYQEHNHSEGDSACTVQGIYDRVGHGWQLGYAWVDPGGWAPHPGTPYVRCHPYSVNVVSQGVGYHLGQGANGTDPIGADNNAAVFQLFFDYNKQRVGAYNFMRQANIHLYDRYNPAFTTARSASDGWRDDSLPGGGTQTYSRTIGVSDQGLGVKYIDLWVPDSLGGSTQNRRTHPCTGAAYAPAPNGPCPANWQQTFQYTLPEGRNTLVPRGFDIGWRYTQPDYSWQQPIDRSAPKLTLSGPLWDHRNDNPLAPGSYGLNVLATDGNTSSPAAQRSGVKNIKITVDGDPAHATPDQTCAPSSCPMSTDWTFVTSSWEPGPHELVVTATDQLGHASSQKITVTLDSAQTPVAMCGPNPTTSEDGVIDELEIQANPSIVSDHGAAFFGARYGGASIRRESCPSRVRVLVKDLQPGEDQAFRAVLDADPEIVDPNRVVTKNVVYQEVTLDQGADRAGDILKEDNVDGPWAVIDDLDAQHIRVDAVAVPTTTRTRIEQAVDPPVVFNIDPNYTGLRLFHGRDDGYPIEAGVEASPGGDCTAGFAVLDGADEKWTTAGHCLPAGYVGDVPCCGNLEGGPLEHNEYQDPTGDNGRMIADAALIDKEDDKISEDVIAGSIHRTVVREMKKSHYDIHRDVCYSGAAGDGRSGCGHIDDHVGKFRDERGRFHRDVYCATIVPAARRGDSGGPIYTRRRDGRAAAAGLVIAGSQAGSLVCFTPMYRVIRALGVDQVAPPGS